MISTDKAVNPSSVMGASKRVAEIYTQALNGRQRLHDAVQGRAVRQRAGLGRVGRARPSAGRSPRAGRSRVTHPEMTRYFMTIPEAAQLVLQAAATGTGGQIFLLDMGEPVKIVDLARQMITLSGFRPGEDIDIVFTGIRPGEKLFEELRTAGRGHRADGPPQGARLAAASPWTGQGQPGHRRAGDAGQLPRTATRSSPRSGAWCRSTSRGIRRRLAGDQAPPVTARLRPASPGVRAPRRA